MQELSAVEDNVSFGIYGPEAQLGITTNSNQALLWYVPHGQDSSRIMIGLGTIVMKHNQSHLSVNQAIG